MENTENKKPKGLYNRQYARAEAEAYAELSFFKKVKNQLFVFYCVVTILSLAFTLGNVEGFEDILIGILIYVILLPFIFYNHRWAIILTGVLYLTDKVIFIVAGIGSPVSHILFGIVVGILSYNAFLVASELKKLKKHGSADVFD